jgi:hypothetical protein
MASATPQAKPEVPTSTQRIPVQDYINATNKSLALSSFPHPLSLEATPKHTILPLLVAICVQQVVQRIVKLNPQSTNRHFKDIFSWWAWDFTHDGLLKFEPMLKLEERDTWHEYMKEVDGQE